jgi:hypothetical protein
MGALVLAGNTSGSVTVDVPAVAGSNTVTIPASTGNVVLDTTSQTLTNKTLTSPTITGANISSMASSIITSGTAVASTSGTSIDFTSIPSWVKRITVMFNGVSTNGTSVVQIQLGSGSPTTTGYNIGASSSPNATAPTVTQPTTGFPIVVDGNAAYTRQGFIVFTNVSGNIWVGSGVGGENVGGRYWTCGGSISLAGVLDRVRITTVNGTDTFDAGSINILYE